MKEEPSSALADLARSAETVQWKSKNAAARWPLVPGLGQFYVGETRNDAIRITVALAAAGAIVVSAAAAEICLAL